MEERLTNQKYWEKYYDEVSLEKNSVLKICDYYNPVWKAWMSYCKKKPETVIEIGAYPGRYISYFGSKFGLKPSGIDFNSDVNKIAQSMKIMGVSDYEYIQKDLFEYVPEKKYDLVFSNGLVEHFSNFHDVLDKHLEYMHNGSSLLIIIPNKNYLRKYYGLLLDKKNLMLHNLECMNLKTFKDFSVRNKLKAEYLSYYGGFAYAVHEPLNNIFKRLFYAVSSRFAKILNPWLEKHPSKYWSSVIIGIFTFSDE